MINRLKKFIADEGITLKRLFNPVFVVRLLIKTKYAHFFLAGVSGVLIQLSLTWFFAEFVFGRERYFDAYLIGLLGGLSYLFTFHTFVTFKTKAKHTRRFFLFFAYSLCMSGLQAILVKTITPIVGLEYYLIVIASIILFFSTVSFLLFKFALFKD